MKGIKFFIYCDGKNGKNPPLFIEYIIMRGSLHEKLSKITLEKLLYIEGS